MSNEEKIAGELNIRPSQVSAVVKLLGEGATVPFISRYRKEATGSLDDVQVTQIRDRITQLRELDSRKDAILKSIREQNKLTPELEKKILAVTNMSLLEDLYLPYKPKRKTRASIAKEKGLEPLASLLMEQKDATNPQKEARKYINNENGVENEEDALKGARDILAEMINEQADARQKIRRLYEKKALVTSNILKSKKELPDAAKYKDYFDWSEPLPKIPSHRLLAIRRGEKEGFLSMHIAPEEADAISILENHFVKGANAASKQVILAIKDAYKRLMSVSIETEVRMLSKKKADEEAIAVFAENLTQLLMAAPLGQKNVMALDPGFRTGCKVVCLDAQGKLLANTTIYPNAPQNDIAKAGETVMKLIEEHKVEAIAIGNGTASRETANFVKNLNVPSSIVTAIVNENGASIYSASAVARDEFPNQDVTVRGAVSIGRRLMDPLAELVKLDAKSIGVGQYQHDVDQAALKKSLDDVVSSCVNGVGVELNTASKQLLTYVSGLGESIAENIVKYRNEHGAFGSRNELRKVPRLGEKAYEQAAGFLRIRDAEDPLDQSAVHPERYATVAKMASDLNTTVRELMSKAELRNLLNLKEYKTEDVGLPTLRDILQELNKPGRDPRAQFEAIVFQDGVNELSDLQVGMKLPGVVTNLTKFGAFVDVGVHQDGLVHVSHMADRFVSDPAQVVKLGQKVSVKVLEVDIPRKRISLSMKQDTVHSPKPSSKTRQKPNRTSRENKPEVNFQDKLEQLKGKWK